MSNSELSLVQNCSVWDLDGASSVEIFVNYLRGTVYDNFASHQESQTIHLFKDLIFVMSVSSESSIRLSNTSASTITLSCDTFDTFVS